MFLDFSSAEEGLSELIQDNIDNPNEEQINKIRSYWDGEPWYSIVEKFQTEGSVWYVWWTDGVSAYLKVCLG